MNQLKRRSSAQNFQTNKSSDSSTSLQQSSKKSHYTDIRYPKGLVQKHKKGKVSRSLIKTFVTIGIEEQDQIPQKKIHHRRIPRIKILNDFGQFNSQHNLLRSAKTSKSVRSDLDISQDQSKCLSQVDEVLQQQQQAKIHKKKCKFLKDNNQFNTPDPSKLFPQNIHFSNLTQDIAQVVQIEDKKDKHLLSSSSFKLKVDELDQEPKKTAVQVFEQIEQQKNQDQEQKKHLHHPIIISDGQMIGHQLNHSLSFQRHQSYDQPCSQIEQADQQCNES